MTIDPKTTTGSLSKETEFPTIPPKRDTTLCLPDGTIMTLLPDGQTTVYDPNAKKIAFGRRDDERNWSDPA